MVKSKLSKLKTNKVSGIDLVGTRILIELSEVIYDYVAELYNNTLSIVIYQAIRNYQKLHRYSKKV